MDIASTEGLRHRNRALVLNSLRAHGAMSHTEIAEKSGLASGSVTAISAELLAESVLVKKDQPPKSGRGRPRSLFQVNQDFAFFAIIRISSGSVEYSLVDYRGILIDRIMRVRNATEISATKFEIDFKTTLLEFLGRSNVTPFAVKSVAITTKGIVDEATCKLLWSPVFDTQTIDFGTLLKPEWNTGVTLTNETCFTAHHMLQQADSSGRHAVISLGDSIGLGIASATPSGEIDLVSPSFGHMAHTANGPLCRCGAKGCLETHTGFYGILRTAFDAPEGVIPAKFIPIEQMQRIAGDARNGSRMTSFAFRNAGAVLGTCLSRMFNIFGAMPVTITGPGLEFFDLMQEGFMEQINTNLLVRLGQPLELSFVQNEPGLVFESNVSVTLRHFDETQVATRKVTVGPL
jgi:predicted NBD/HSP70 family sugar kinase